MRELTVNLGERSYPVLVGPGARRSLRTLVPGRSTRAAIVTQPGVGVEVDAGVEQLTFLIGDGEKAKSMSTVEELCSGFAEFGLTRADIVVGVGGGVVTDVAGFAAAVYHRGVAVAHVATTLLGQVDAAIGGKTGVNLPEGKNLVGAFWQPVAVICDTEVLSTLSPREYRSGLGEMAKYAFLGEPPRPGTDIDEQVARCVAIKAEVVAADEREGDRRMILNYGHTLAHALEGVGLSEHPEWDLRHGEAVAIGVVFAALLAQRLGRIDGAKVKEHRAVVGGYDLPSALPEGAVAAELVTFMGRDKKAQQDLTFVLDGPEGVEVVRGVDRADVLATLADMGAQR